MELSMKIINKEMIKPSSPTPNHLKVFNLSLLDQLSHSHYGTMLLFFSKSKAFTVSQQSKLLKSSLSEFLTRFYPLAGRIKDNFIIECNDEGAVYLEAQVGCALSKVLENPDNRVIRNFLAVENLKASSESELNALLLIQVSFFACGGLAIGSCISHKIADARTVCTFFTGWAATALGVDHEAIRPNLKVSSSIFPPQNLPSKFAMKFDEEKCVTRSKRFVFHASGISALKAKSASEAVKQPSRVEAVTALIWKCATRASRSTSGQTKISVLAQSVNIRKKMVPPLPHNSMGNLMGHFTTRIMDGEIDLAKLVAQMRKGLQDFGENYVRKLQQGNALTAIFEALKEMGSFIHGGNAEFYIFSSLCKFPFYDTDFGFGKPTWVAPPREAIKNIIQLIDSEDGDSIEAWVTLKEEDMAIFERDRELLAVAYSNPNVFGTIMPVSCL